MKAIVGIALTAGLFVAPSTTASAADRTDTARTTAAHVATAKSSAVIITDFTAKRRKHRTVAVAPIQPSQVAPAHSGWTGPDPSKGPGIAILRQLQRDGRCVIDEGYGRYTFCSNM